MSFEEAQLFASNPDAPLPQLVAPEPLDVPQLPGWLATLRGTVSGLTARSEVLAQRLQVASARAEQAEKDFTESGRAREKLSAQQAEDAAARTRAERLAKSAQDEVERYKAIYVSMSRAPCARAGR
jgi:hypothetical protein